MFLVSLAFILFGFSFRTSSFRLQNKRFGNRIVSYMLRLTDIGQAVPFCSRDYLCQSCSRLRKQKDTPYPTDVRDCREIGRSSRSSWIGPRCRAAASSRRDLYNALLCTPLQSQFSIINLPNFLGAIISNILAKLSEFLVKFSQNDEMKK